MKMNGILSRFPDMPKPPSKDLHMIIQHRFTCKDYDRHFAFANFIKLFAITNTLLIAVPCSFN
jgi:hypothetical protein